MQAKGASTWPQPPGAPTIGTATVTNGTTVSVAFTAPSCTGYPAGITGYTAKSTPGCITGTGASSPISVSGLTTGTAYTFKVKATNTSGSGPCSAASNSVTPLTIGQQAYTTSGSYSWVAPSGVTSVSIVAVGAGGKGAGGGGELRYKNNITVIPGNSYTVVVGATNSTGGAYAGSSTFNSTTVIANGGQNGTSGSQGGVGGSGGTGDGGGAGGSLGVGGAYGGGGGLYFGSGSNGSGGAVRIIWPGTTRSFPSTCTGNL